MTKENKVRIPRGHIESGGFCAGKFKLSDQDRLMYRTFGKLFGKPKTKINEQPIEQSIEQLQDTSETPSIWSQALLAIDTFLDMIIPSDSSKPKT